jgi:uracil-DNA glycosylase
VTRAQAALDRHVTLLRQCTLCPRMLRPPVSGGPVLSRVMLVGQAPGTKEPVLGRPFAWTAGRTLFAWFQQYCSVSEPEFRASVYMAAVCRCFPGKNTLGGDRVPDREEIANCSRWLATELEIIRPALVIPVGKLAIQQFGLGGKLTDVIGRIFPGELFGHRFDVIPLPHPSGASPWHRIEPGKTLLAGAMHLICGHPGFVHRLGAGAVRSR